MEYIIGNGCLQVTATNLGAQLLSVQKDGKEYLWQRDAKYWSDSAPNIFPYVARLTNESYLYGGQTYKMKIHGFVCNKELTLEEYTDERMTFVLEQNEDTLKQYPWKFTYRISYYLDGNTLHVKTQVLNRDDKVMYFGHGGHPGFIVPLDEGLAFEDYYLEFPEARNPIRVGFTDTCFLNREDVSYIMDDKKRIMLRHDLFNQDAIVLKNGGHEVRLGSDRGNSSVVVRLPGYPIIGIWHQPNTDAPYVCIEPWSSLPSRDGVVEDFAKQEDLISLESGKTYEAEWTIEFE